MGCHGAAHGSPYTDKNGKRWTSEEVNRRLGLAVAARQDILLYVIGKIGSVAGQEYLLRAYHLAVTLDVEDYPPGGLR
jgi:hypothetical protein